MSSRVASKAIIYMCVMTALSGPVEVQSRLEAVPESVRQLFDGGLGRYRRGDYGKAITAFDEVIRQQPTFVDAYIIRGAAYHGKGLPDKALADFNRAIQLDPKSPRACCDRADLEDELLRQPDRALADYSQAIRLAPSFQRAYLNRGSFFMGQRDYTRAIADYSRAIQLIPNDLSAYATRAQAYARQGDHARAVFDAKMATKLKLREVPLGRVVNLQARAKAYQILGQPDLALRDFREAVRLMPNNPSAQNAIAWFFATCPDERFRNGTEAVSAAKKACELSHWKRSDCIDTLAAAYAEAGDFDQAAKYARRSLNDPSVKTRKEREQRVGLFEQRKPFREDLARHP